MGAAGRLGLCLLLGAVTPRAAVGELTECPSCPWAFCLNATHCGCPPGYDPPPWPHSLSLEGTCDDINECLQSPPRCGPHQSCINTPGGFNCSCDPGYQQEPPPGGDPPSGTPPLNCVDVDECEEGGDLGGLCMGGSVCFNTPGSFECHCGEGTVGTPQGGCIPVVVPPNLCPKEQGSCELVKTLTHIREQLQGGGDPPDPHHVLQELLATLARAVSGVPGAPPSRHRWVTTLLGVTEGLLGGVGALLPPGTVAAVTLNDSDLGVTLSRGPPSGPITLRVPGVQLEVPGEAAGDRDTGPVTVALLSQGGRLRQALEGAPQVRGGAGGALLPPSGQGTLSYRVLSPVATALVSGPWAPPGVTLRFQHPRPDPKLGGQLLCAFWDPQEQLWDTRGCQEEPSPSPGTPPHPGGPPTSTSTTSCSCDHLTSFAVLMAFQELEESWVLDVVTQVGLGVSLVSLGVAAATFALCPALKGLRATLHLHLSLSLLLAQGTFLLGIDRPQPAVGCAVVAGVLHFSFLSAFCWMGLEGLHLYILLVRVFAPSWLRQRHLLLAGYGPPALLVALAAAVFPDGYGTKRYCWLSLERGFRWSFQGPVCVIIALNALILVVTIWTLVQKFNEVNPDGGHLRKMRVLVATGVGQLSVLGTGWALGAGLGAAVPRPGGGLDPQAFLFCALNAAQGLFILLCHCLAHPQVREAYRAALCPGTKPYSEFTSNTSNTRVSRQSAYT